MSLSHDAQQRYARHLILPEVGPEGQERLRSARVLCVGVGGLGSPAAMYLAAAGIGRLGILDFDAVDLSNLQRQLLHGTSDIGRPKTDSARDTLEHLNPDVEVVAHQTQLTPGNALEILGAYDVVVDGTDNFPARYLVNDACVFLKKPNIYGAIFRFEGQASVFAPHLGAPCYRCLYPAPPPPGLVPSCAEAGVLGVVPGIIGTLQAAEALKLLLGQGTPLLGRLLVLDALEMRFRELKVRRDPRCALCGEYPTITQLVDGVHFCSTTSRPQPSPTHSDEVTAEDLQRALENPTLGIEMLDVREPTEPRQTRIPGARLFPLSTLAGRTAELDPAREYYLFCAIGIRSLDAVRFLRGRGFTRVKSVRGGILAWAREITPGEATGQGGTEVGGAGAGCRDGSRRS